MIKLGALWKSKDKDGNPILSGTINDNARIVILKNGFKQADNHPDYILYVQENDKKRGGQKIAVKPEQEKNEDF